MLAPERQKQILQKLQSQGQVLVQNLVRELGVSEDTIRRDLKELASTGLLKKVHGGAIAASTVPYAHAERRRLNREAKAAMALKATQFIQNGMLIFMDGGTTTLEVAPHLKARNLENVTVVTHSPVMAQSLSEIAGLEVFLLGGKLIKDLLIAVGPNSLKEASRFRPDLSIVSAHGMSASAGATVESGEDAAVKRQFIENSAETLVLAGHEKIGFVASFQIAALDEISYLITDEVKDLSTFQKSNLTVLACQ